MEFETATSKFDLTLFRELRLGRKQREMEVSVEYSLDLFEAKSRASREC